MKGIVEHEIKRIWLALILFVFLVKPLYEGCLIGIKERVGKKKNTFDTNRNADCLLKNMFTKQNKYVVNKKLKHFDDVSVI